MPNAVVALSGVARCRRLLVGMVEFHTKHADLVGGFARAHFETWIWTMFLLLDGDEARRRLNANDVKEARRRAEDILEVFSTSSVADAALEGARTILATTTPADARAHMNLIDATKAVVSLLEARGERVPDFPRKLYAALYRGESQLSIHWGLQLAKTHLTTEVAGSVVIADPPPRQIENRRLELATSALLSIAGEAASQLGLATDRVVDFGRAWFESTRFPTSAPGL